MTVELGGLRGVSGAAGRTALDQLRHRLPRLTHLLEGDHLVILEQAHVLQKQTNKQTKTTGSNGFNRVHGPPTLRLHSAHPSGRFHHSLRATFESVAVQRLPRLVGRDPRGGRSAFRG